ncbi:uncharacterized protein [Embiotoca jacksoni]|uniref:uncharacterized protein isoform X2 n=1 Tax=Embiotoca jacksoni TaxID=100190 RepID=UPI003703A9B5
MLMMFRLNQQALLLIQPLLMWQVFAETARKDYNNEMVSSGEKVVLICNISEKDTTQINWSKGRYVLAFHIKMNRTYSNFSSDRVRIDLDLPTKLIIISAQPDDAGLYTCNLTGAGMNSIGWNLTVSENPKEIIPSEDFVYALPLAIGLLLCGIMSAVCLCRKCGTKTPNQAPVQDQFHLQSGPEVVLAQPQSGTAHRTNKTHRSQYIERLNSIYGQ